MELPQFLTCKRQPLEHIGQLTVGLHATGLGGLNERVKQCTGLAAVDFGLPVTIKDVITVGALDDWYRF